MTIRRFSHFLLPIFNDTTFETINRQEYAPHHGEIDRVQPLIAISLMVLVTIFVRVIAASGLDPVLVGTLVTLQLAIGSATPPFGIDMFTAMSIFKKPYFKLSEEPLRLL